MNISDILKTNPDAVIAIRARDLHAFGQGLIAEAKKELATEKNIDPLLTTAEVEERLKKSYSTLRRYRLDGRLVPMLVGGTYMYRASDVNAFLEKNITNNL
jgi:hypothetical protein